MRKSKYKEPPEKIPFPKKDFFSTFCLVKCFATGKLWGEVCSNSSPVEFILIVRSLCLVVVEVGFLIGWIRHKTSLSRNDEQL